MAKDDAVKTGVAAFQVAVVQVVADQIGAAYDTGATDQKASDGSFTQADIDAAVAAAQGIDAKELADAQVKASSDLAALQASFDAMAAKDTSLQAQLDAVKSSVAALSALLSS